MKCNTTFVGCKSFYSALNLIDDLNPTFGGGLEVKTNTFRRRITLYLMILATSFALRAHGQNSNSGEIKGTVTDSSGAVVSGAEVTITDILTNTTTKTKANGAGIYDVPS